MCVCLCVCTRLLKNNGLLSLKTNNGLINLKLEHNVVKGNSLNEFNNGHCPIKVKVMV